MSTARAFADSSPNWTSFHDAAHRVAIFEQAFGVWYSNGRS
ncbi:MAG: hypothetical protein ABI240_04625 [Sphingomonas sp.]